MEDQNNILLALGRLEGKVDSLISQTRSVQVDVEKHADRIRSLENSKAYMIGASAVLASVVSFIVTYLQRTL